MDKWCLGFQLWGWYNDVGQNIPRLPVEGRTVRLNLDTLVPKSGRVHLAESV